MPPKAPIVPLTEVEKEYLDEKFEGYTKHIAKKFKLPMIGLAVVFAGAVAIFATYLYMQARTNVMESQLDLTQASITFYKGMSATGEKMANLVKDMQFTADEFNERAAQAGLSVGLMDKYEKQMKAAVEKMEALAKRHYTLKKNKPSNHPKEVKSVGVPKEAPVSAPPPPPPIRLEKSQPQEKGNVFEIPGNIQQQIQQRKIN